MLDIPGDLQLLSSGWSNHTPWQTPREESEEELYARLDALAQQVRDPRKAVFMIHVPPHDSGLDTAPLLDENLRPTISAGDVLRGPVGSTAVRRLIETYQPLLAIHGHIHESGGERKIGKTLCINPAARPTTGSSAATSWTSARRASSSPSASRAKGRSAPRPQNRIAATASPWAARRVHRPATNSSIICATLTPSVSNPGGP